MPIENTSILEEMKFEIWKAYYDGFAQAHSMYNRLPAWDIHKMFFKNALHSHTRNYLETTIKDLTKISEDINKGGCNE